VIENTREEIAMAVSIGRWMILAAGLVGAAALLLDFGACPDSIKRGLARVGFLLLIVGGALMLVGV